MTATLTEPAPTSGPVAVQISRRPDVDTIILLPDLEAVVESEKCSCNAGDDNPY